MKNFMIFILVLAGFGFWFKGWAQSGKMDSFISNHKDSSLTPKLIYTLSQICYLSQEPKAASHYQRWFIQDYPDHPKAPAVRWQLSQCYEDMKRRDLATEQYIILKDSYTTTQEGQLALSAYNRSRF